MMRSLRELLGYTIKAADGRIGRVNDFFFGDQAWIVRHLTARTGGWLAAFDVLVSPDTVGVPDRSAQTLPVALTKEQVQNSPPIDADKPVSLQMEAELHWHHDWFPYWRISGQAVVNPKSWTVC
jgi:hypothetical protein